jgi:chromosome segregation ATPase
VITEKNAEIGALQLKVHQLTEQVRITSQLFEDLQGTLPAALIDRIETDIIQLGKQWEQINRRIVELQSRRGERTDHAEWNDAQITRIQGRIDEIKASAERRVGEIKEQYVPRIAEASLEDKTKTNAVIDERDDLIAKIERQAQERISALEQELATHNASLAEERFQLELTSSQLAGLEEDKEDLVETRQGLIDGLDKAKTDIEKETDAHQARIEELRRRTLNITDAQPESPAEEDTSPNLLESFQKAVDSVGDKQLQAIMLELKDASTKGQPVSKAKQDFIDRLAELIGQNNPKAADAYKELQGK